MNERDVLECLIEDFQIIQWFTHPKPALGQWERAIRDQSLVATARAPRVARCKFYHSGSMAGATRVVQRENTNIVITIILIKIDRDKNTTRSHGARKIFQERKPENKDQREAHKTVINDLIQTQSRQLHQSSTHRQ